MGSHLLRIRVRQQQRVVNEGQQHRRLRLLRGGREGVFQDHCFLVQLWDRELFNAFEDRVLGKLRDAKFDIHQWKLMDSYYYLNAFLRNLPSPLYSMTIFHPGSPSSPTSRQTSPRSFLSRLVNTDQAGPKGTAGRIEVRSRDCSRRLDVTKVSTEHSLPSSLRFALGDCRSTCPSLGSWRVSCCFIALGWFSCLVSLCPLYYLILIIY